MTPTSGFQKKAPDPEEEHSVLVSSLRSWPLYEHPVRQVTEPTALSWGLAETKPLSGKRRVFILLHASQTHQAPDVDLLVNFLQEQESPLAVSIRDKLQSVLSSSMVRRLTSRESAAQSSISVLSQQVERLERKVEELADELKSRPVTSSAAILDLDSDEVALSQPVQIVIEQYEDEVTASWLEVDAFGSGVCASDAILALKKDIVRLYLDLQAAPDAELGILPFSWKRTLGMVVVSHGATERQTA